MATCKFSLFSAPSPSPRVAVGVVVLFYIVVALRLTLGFCLTRWRVRPTQRVFVVALVLEYV